MPTAADEAYGAIRQGILDGSIPLGGRLKESELAARIGVSRTPVREALRRLEVEGLVSYSSHAGVQVVLPSARDLGDLFDLRALLEGLGAQLSAERATPSEVEQLGLLAEEMHRLGRHPTPTTIDRIAELNNRFHRGVIAGAHSDRVSAVFGGIIDVPLVYRTFHRYSPDELERSLTQHREIVAALKERDGEWARSAMQNHIRAGRRVATNLAGDGDFPLAVVKR